MKRVTIWLSKLPDRGDWEHNHIEDGWSTRDVPHAINESQAKAWKSYHWMRLYGEMDDENKVTVNDPPDDVIMPYF